MESTSRVLLTLGAILLLGLITSAIGRRTFLPRVTLLLLFGAVIGSDALDLIPGEISARFELVANVALLRRLYDEEEGSLPWLSALGDDRLTRALDAILDAPEKPHTLESVAKTAGMSRSASGRSRIVRAPAA